MEEDRLTLEKYVRDYCPPSMVEFFRENKHIVEAISIFLSDEDDGETQVTPPIGLIFSSLHLVSMDRGGLLPNSLKVVMLLQDPYPNDSAHGVAMSTVDGTLPMHVRNVGKVLLQYKEDIPEFSSGDLRGWCSQGVLLWNTALTTRVGISKSHTQEWSVFSQRFIKYLSSTFDFLVFVLFGADAKTYTNDIDQSRHRILITSNPVAWEDYNTFLTSNIFTKINSALEEGKRSPVRWEDSSYV